MTDNQQRAAELLFRSTPIGQQFRTGSKDVLAAALDEAEARGREEVAATVKSLIDNFDGPDVSGRRLARCLLRALDAEETSA